MSTYPPTKRLFLLGAGFSKPADFPVAAELLPAVKAVAASYFRADEYSLFEYALEEYESYLREVQPGRDFDLEEFGAWLDWQHVLRMEGPDTFSELGSEANLQFRWAIGKVLYEFLPREIPELYLDFARRLTTSDTILTLNYDLLLERALEAVGLPYRRFPGRSVDSPDELVIHKLHGSLDWALLRDRDEEAVLGLRRLVTSPVPGEEPLAEIGVIPASTLPSYYSSPTIWCPVPPFLMPPSTAKPLAGSRLIPLWNGVGLFAYQRGGVTVIGCSLAPGEPYVLQLVHHIATDYAAGRSEKAAPWPQRRMKVVDLQSTETERKTFLDRYQFFDPQHTDFYLNGFCADSLEVIFDESA